MSSVVSNFAFSVRDLAQSVNFYTEVFGFVAVGERRRTGEAVEPLVEVPGAVLEVQFMQNEDTFIELFSFVQPGQVTAGTHRPLNQVSGVHLAMCVDDLKEAGAAVARNGGTVHWGSRISFQAPGRETSDFMYCFDPDGIRIELMSHSARTRDTLNAG
jgi:predicted enzyme related to lactoylglutathione lyase